MDKNKKLLASLGILFCAIVWGSAYFVIKDSLVSLEPMTVVSYRFLIASMPLLLYIVLTGKNPFRNFKFGLLLGVFLWLVFGPQGIGLKYTSAAHTGFINNTFILFVPFAAYFILKKKITLEPFIAIGISFVGLFFLTGGLKNMNAGDFLVLFSAVATGTHLVFISRFANKAGLDVLTLSFQQFFTVAMLSLIMHFIFESGPILTMHIFSKELIYLGLIATLGGFVVQLFSQKAISELTTSLVLSTQPVFSTFFAIFFAGEVLGKSQVAGGILLVVAPIIYQVIQSRNFRNKIPILADGI